jgi:hypothetical protein
MTNISGATNSNLDVGFIPRSAIGTNAQDILKRRIEHDLTPLNLQVCWYLSPENLAEAKLEPEVLDALTTNVRQPVYGTLLAADADTFAKYRDRLPASIPLPSSANWQLPADLWGYVFIACPLPPLPSETTFIDRMAGGDRMALNGDGMIYRVGFEAGQAQIKTRIMKTPCYYADLAAQLLPTKYNKFGYRFFDGGLVRHSLFLGTRNQMNTAFLATKEHLLVTFDAARPHIIDPDTLELLAPIGSALGKSWTGLAPKLPPILNQVFQPCSNPAHPLCDRVKPIDAAPTVQPAGEIVTANFSAGFGMVNIFNRLRKRLKERLNQDGVVLTNSWGGFTDLIRYRLNDDRTFDKDDRNFEKWRLFLPNREPVIIEQAIHQMCLTEDYILIGDVAFKIELAQIFAPFLIGKIRKISAYLGYLLSITFIKLVQPPSYANVYLVKRADLDRHIPEGEHRTLTAIKVTLPREVSHFVVDYHNPEGKITLMAAHGGGWDVTEWVSEYDESVNSNCPDYEAMSPIVKSIAKLEKLVNGNKHVPAVKCLNNKDALGMLPAPADLNSLGRYTIDGETGAVITANLLSDAGDNPSRRNTWSLSVNTHRNLNRDSTQTENQVTQQTSGEITSLYWMSWGFSWEILPKRIYQAYRDRDNRTIPVEGLPNVDMPASLLRLDTQQMKIVDSFEFPIGYLTRSPQFIPSQAPCPEGKDPATHGYIFCVIMADANPEDPQSDAKDEIWIFHADDFKGKPIYRLSNSDINLGLMIHSTWIPQLDFGKKYSAADRQTMRKNTLDRDFYPIVQAKILPHAKDLFREFVEPHYVNQTSEADLLNLQEQ